MLRNKVKALIRNRWLKLKVGESTSNVSISSLPNHSDEANTNAMNVARERRDDLICKVE